MRQIITDQIFLMGVFVNRTFPFRVIPIEVITLLHQKYVWYNGLEVLTYPISEKNYWNDLLIVMLVESIAHLFAVDNPLR